LLNAAAVGRSLRRFALVLCIVAALCAAGGASARTSGVTIRGLSKPVYPGQTIQLRVMVRPHAVHCVATIRYMGGKVQRLGDRVAGPKGATWSFRIPAVRPGSARAGVDCGEAGRASIPFKVTAALQAPRIITERTGFSQRLNRDGSTDVCFGLQLRNDRARVDATHVAVLVNLVTADNRVIATDHLRFVRIPAGATVYIGDQISRIVNIPITRVEVVAVEATSTPVQPATPPLISDIQITPNREGYVDKVYAQLLNQSALILQGGELGTVILDSAGNIIGGGRGTVQGPVSLGARELSKTFGQLDAVPYASAAEALISVVPRYPRQP
jgi:hypothetical protein